MLGDNAPVLLPPACFLRDPEVGQKLLWENMTVVQPWDMDDIAPEVFSTSGPVMQHVTQAMSALLGPWKMANDFDCCCILQSSH